MNDERPISRRAFTALTVAAGIGATGLRATGVASAAAAAAEPLETDIVVKTPAGDCDAALVHPQGSGGPWPAVILFVDAFGLRPATRDMAKRLAAGGYTVLVPNPYYRSVKAPGMPAPAAFDFGNAADRAKLSALRAPLTGEAVMQDAAAYVAYLDAQPSVHKKAKMGVVGYCMGGPMTLQAAAAAPQRIGAGASFHGGGLVTDKPDSPHLLVPKIRAQYYFGIAASDDAKEPDTKTTLATAFHDAGKKAKIEVYDNTLHGWCMPDMAVQNGKPIYDAVQAERAWSELLSLYRQVPV